MREGVGTRDGKGKGEVTIGQNIGIAPHSPSSNPLELQDAGVIVGVLQM